MKKVFGVLTILFVMTMIIQSCKKDPNIKTTAQSITPTIIANQIYRFDLEYFGDEEGASILFQQIRMGN